MGLLLHGRGVPQALQGAINELRRLCRPGGTRRRPGTAAPGGSVMSTTERASAGPAANAGTRSPRCDVSPCSAPPGNPGPPDGAGLPDGCRTRGGRIASPAPAGPAGRLDRRGRRPALQRQDRALLALLCGYLGQALSEIPDRSGGEGNGPGPATGDPRRRPAARRAARCAANRPLEVGGDWYNIVELPDGRIGIVVGDCVERLDAATVMGQLRSACRPAPAGRERGPDAHRHGPVRRPHPRRHLRRRIFCGILDRDAGRLIYSSAGHPRHPGAAQRAHRAARRRSLVPASGGGQPDIEQAGELYRARPGRHCCCTPTAWSARAPVPWTPGSPRPGRPPVRRGDASAVEDLATAIMTAMAPGRRL